VKSQLVSRYRKVIPRLAWLFAIWLSVVAILVVLMTPYAWGAAWGVVAVLIGLAWQRRRRQGDTAVAARTALLVGVAAVEVNKVGADPLLVIAIAALLGSLLAEEPVEPLLKPRLIAYRLPGLNQPIWAHLRGLYSASVIGTGVLAVAVAIPVPGWVAGAVVLVLVGIGAGLALRQLLRRRRHLAEREIAEALAQWSPGYCFHFDGKPEAAYQLQMWLPYLAATGERGALIVRDPRFVPRAHQITDLPVIVVERVEPIESLLVASVGAFFYVNNSARNVDGTRYPQITHVHLGHGDSDKPSSYAASTTMFDQIFVAGQAGADRFARHGVDVPASKFVLVGRPQAEQIRPRSRDDLPPRPSVLYAPTWRGVLSDMQLSSLDKGAQVIEALLAAGARVIFRPHPYSARDATSRALIDAIDARLVAADGDHLTSAAARELSIFECINASDAMVTDISSVASDYLYSDKPLALTYRGDPSVIQATYPLADAAQLVDLDGELAAAVAGWLTEDPQRHRRAKTRHYYLGPWTAAESVEVFVEAATKAIQTGRSR
jgi:hypothetical protein